MMNIILLSSNYDMSIHSNLIGVLCGVIAFLGVLVTLLVGWQIYTVFDLRKRVNQKLDESKQEINTSLKKYKQSIKERTESIENKLTQDIHNKTNKSLGASLGSIGKSMVDMDHIPSAMWFYLMGARQLQNIDNAGYSYLIGQFAKCLELLVDSPKYRMDEHTKISCLKTLRELDSEGINELIISLASIPTKIDE